MRRGPSPRATDIHRWQACLRPVLGSHEPVVCLLPGHTPTGLHEATDVLVDLVFDESRTLTQVHRLGQAWLVVGRLEVEPGVQRAATSIELGRSGVHGNDPQRGRGICFQVRTSKLLPRCAP